MNKEKELTLEEAENIIDKMYQNKFVECGVEDGNTIHMGNFDKLQFSNIEKASILLLRTEIRQQQEIERLNNIINEIRNCILTDISMLKTRRPEISKEETIMRLEATVKLIDKLKELKGE